MSRVDGIMLGLRMDGLPALSMMVMLVEKMSVLATQWETACQTLFIPWYQVTFREVMLSPNKRFVDSTILVPKNIPLSHSGALCVSFNTMKQSFPS